MYLTVYHTRVTTHYEEQCTKDNQLGGVFEVTWAARISIMMINAFVNVELKIKKNGN